MFHAFRALMIVLALAAPVHAQQAGVRFGGLSQDTSLPVEVTSESLSVDQADGSAIFTGNVLVKQGEMQMTAATIRVEYADGGQGIQRLHASGGVTLVSPTDAAEADDAVYTIATGAVVMTGNVLMTQGAAAISGDSLTVDLKDGTGTVTGNVKTIFSPGQSR
jgi:lipopolysaccharide export system protein LptA